MAKYRKKSSVNDFKRSDTNNMLWGYFQRFTKINRIKNKNIDFFKINKLLLNVMTFKECEIVYQLPRNTCVRDYTNGVMSLKHVRKSMTTYIITISEAQRLYENYWTERAHKNESHLYSGYDGKKLTEKEFVIMNGSKYELVEE